MRVGIDIDGCVRDIHTKLVQVYRREMDSKVHWCEPPDKWYEYNISKHFSIDSGIHDFWFKTHAEEIYTKALPFPDIGEIEQLHKNGDYIVVITDQPNPETERYTLQWIRTYMPYAKEIHFTSNKQFVHCDIYLDDAPHHIERIHNHDEGHVVVMNRRWNQDINIRGVSRVDSLSGFANTVRGM